MNAPPPPPSSDADASVDELTAIAQDYLKAIWSDSEWGGAPATVKSLATRFAVTSATASDTIRRLAADRLVEHQPYGSITLTASGQRHALTMVRRHRLIETFLAEILGYGPDEVHDDAEQLEHTVSELFLDRIDVLLGHPTADPHGDPIPDRNGSITFPHDAVQLTAAGPGRFTIARLSDRDPARLAHLMAEGIVPGAPVTVQPRNAYAPITVTTTEGSALALTDASTDAVYVTPANGPRGRKYAPRDLNPEPTD